MAPDSVRFQIYVDDPAFAIRSTPRDLATALAWYSAEGYPLAWHKSSGGDSLEWIGAQLQINSEALSVSIPEKKCADLLNLSQSFLNGSPVTSRKDLRSYAGKVSFVAGLIPTVKPFLSSLWATVTSPNTSAGPSRRLRRVARLPASLVPRKKMLTFPLLAFCLLFRPPRRINSQILVVLAARQL